MEHRIEGDIVYYAKDLNELIDEVRELKKEVESLETRLDEAERDIKFLESE